MFGNGFCGIWEIEGRNVRPVGGGFILESFLPLMGFPFFFWRRARRRGAA